MQLFIGPELLEERKDTVEALNRAATNFDHRCTLIPWDLRQTLATNIDTTTIQAPRPRLSIDMNQKRMGRSSRFVLKLCHAEKLNCA
jgi:hypothetical protein